MLIAGLAASPVALSRTRLTNAAVAVGREGHDTGYLFDFKLLAGPAQALAKHTGRRHYGSARTADHGARFAAPTLAAAASSPSAAPSRGGILACSGAVELALEQALRIVAIGLVELPVSGKIHAGGRCLRKLFGGACCKTNHCQNHDESHAAILSDARGDEYLASRLSPDGANIPSGRS
jgi:hypothetical protein